MDLAAGGGATVPVDRECSDNPPATSYNAIPDRCAAGCLDSGAFAAGKWLFFILILKTRVARFRGLCLLLRLPQVQVIVAHLRRKSQNRGSLLDLRCILMHAPRSFKM